MECLGDVGRLQVVVVLFHQILTYIATEIFSFVIESLDRFIALCQCVSDVFTVRCGGDHSSARGQQTSVGVTTRAGMEKYAFGRGELACYLKAFGI